MIPLLSTIRPDERRDTLVAAATLGAIMAGHALLETGRDALFLSHLPATHLPWMYLAIAASILVLGNSRLRILARGWSPSALSAWLLMAVAITVVCWLLVGSRDPRAFYLLYLWTGVFGTLAVARFWSLLGDRLTITQAKRLFGPIGAGGVLGAVAGAACARTLSTRVELRGLVIAGAITFALAAIGPTLLDRRKPRPAPLDDQPGPLECSTEAARCVVRQPYPRRLAILVLLAAMTVTLVDYVFKSAAAGSVAPDALGPFFATVYLALNLASLLFQLFAVGWLLRWVGPSRSLAVLPGLLAGGALSLLVSGHLAIALLLKGFDGGLRHSLHRTALEILYVPLDGGLRLPVKSFIEAAGQRIGQALAALGILAIAVSGWGDRVLPAMVTLLALAWTGVAFGLRRHYLNLFRATLSEGSGRQRQEFPKLDLASLETLMAALNSPDDSEVIAAMDLLADEGRTRLIPALILYHPSAEVTIHALELFARTRRQDFVPIADRLLAEHPLAEVRACALRARTHAVPDPALLARTLVDPTPALQATALVGLVADSPPEAPDEGQHRLLDDLATHGSRDARMALARAIRHRPDPRFAPALEALARDREAEVRLQALRAMRAAHDPVYQPTLLAQLADRGLRAEARRALVEMGPRILDRLADAFDDQDLPLAIRRQLPHTLREFPPRPAATALLGHLLGERDGSTRYRILRALARLKADHLELSLDRTVLRRAIELTLASAFRVLSWRVAIERGWTDLEERRTAVSELMLAFLRDKEEQAIERLFLLLGLDQPHEDYRRIYRGLVSADPSSRASSRELLEHVLRSPIRAPLLALVDELPDEERLARGVRPWVAPTPRDYEEALQRMLFEGNSTLRALAVYHIGELRMRALRTSVESVQGVQPSFLLAAAIDRTLRNLAPGKPRRMHRPGTSR